MLAADAAQSVCGDLPSTRQARGRGQGFGRLAAAVRGRGLGGGRKRLSSPGRQPAASLCGCRKRVGLLPADAVQREKRCGGPDVRRSAILTWPARRRPQRDQDTLEAGWLRRAEEAAAPRWRHPRTLASLRLWRGLRARSAAYPGSTTPTAREADHLGRPTLAASDGVRQPVSSGGGTACVAPHRPCRAGRRAATAATAPDGLGRRVGRIRFADITPSSWAVLALQHRAHPHRHGHAGLGEPREGRVSAAREAHPRRRDPPPARQPSPGGERGWAM
jgi:hypothetical protein